VGRAKLRRTVYQDRITVDPEILVGKPVVKGTRISVELVLEQLAANPDVQALLDSYPRLTLEDVEACVNQSQSNQKK
jgi:uncharacterized protein (DUF433 family)